MKQKSTLFLQAALVIIGVGVFLILLRLPLLEGSVYADPFVLYGYASSIAFFVALYKAFRLLTVIRQGHVFSLGAVKMVRDIKYCTMVLAFLIILAGLFVRIFHHADDDPVGFLVLTMGLTFACAVVALVASVFENILQKGLVLASANEYMLKQAK
jgi:hypothetical protein